MSLWSAKPPSLEQYRSAVNHLGRQAERGDTPLGINARGELVTETSFGHSGKSWLGWFLKVLRLSDSFEKSQLRLRDAIITYVVDQPSLDRRSVKSYRRNYPAIPTINEVRTALAPRRRAGGVERQRATDLTPHQRRLEEHLANLARVRELERERVLTDAPVSEPGAVAENLPETLVSPVYTHSPHYWRLEVTDDDHEAVWSKNTPVIADLVVVVGGEERCVIDWVTEKLEGFAEEIPLPEGFLQEQLRQPGNSRETVAAKVLMVFFEHGAKDKDIKPDWAGLRVLFEKIGLQSVAQAAYDYHDDISRFGTLAEDVTKQYGGRAWFDQPPVLAWVHEELGRAATEVNEPLLDDTALLYLAISAGVDCDDFVTLRGQGGEACLESVLMAATHNPVPVIVDREQKTFRKFQNSWGSLLMHLQNIGLTELVEALVRRLDQAQQVDF